MKRLSLVILTTALLFSLGCGTIINGTTQKVRITGLGTEKARIPGFATEEVAIPATVHLERKQEYTVYCGEQKKQVPLNREQVPLGYLLPEPTRGFRANNGNGGYVHRWK